MKRVKMTDDILVYREKLITNRNEIFQTVLYNLKKTNSPKVEELLAYKERMLIMTDLKFLTIMHLYTELPPVFEISKKATFKEVYKMLKEAIETKEAFRFAFEMTVKPAFTKILNFDSTLGTKSYYDILSQYPRDPKRSLGY